MTRIERRSSWYVWFGFCSACAKVAIQHTNHHQSKMRALTERGHERLNNVCMLGNEWPERMRDVHSSSRRSLCPLPRCLRSFASPCSRSRRSVQGYELSQTRMYLGGKERGTHHVCRCRLAVNPLGRDLATLDSTAGGVLRQSMVNIMRYADMSSLRTK